MSSDIKSSESDIKSSEEVEFIGYDLGHGETAIGRAYNRSMREPEILDYHGEKSFVTAVAKTKSGVKIGADAVNLAALQGSRLGERPKVWVKFKGRDLTDQSVTEPTQLFTQALMEGLSADKKIQGLDHSRFIVGCPSGWSPAVRADYQALFQSSGLKSVRIVPESRAALMTALEQGYLSIEAAKSSVLIVDIGSSTTDFTYCHELDAEDVGHNVLGSGLLDTEIFWLNLERQKDRKKIEKLIHRYPHYRPVMEYWCRLAKEQYFNGSEMPVEIIKRLPIDKGVLFEIRIDKADADKILSKPLEALNDFSWPEAFDFAIKEAVNMLGGRAPETVLLTGGASRLPLVTPACEAAFPDARVVQGAEPEFAIARGLAWLGRFEFMHDGFKKSVTEILREGGPVYAKAEKASLDLGERLSPVLVDALTDNGVIPAFAQWRSGRIESLNDIQPLLEDKVRDWLGSQECQKILRPVINNWFAGLQREIEKDTDPLCRDHGFPAMVLSLDDNQQVSEYLEGMSVAAPKVAGLEADTALVGASLTGLIIGTLAAKASPLIAAPGGLFIAGIIAGGGFLVGKKALKKTFSKANVPVMARQLVTDRRIRAAAKKQRPDMIRTVNEAWKTAATERFTSELIATLNSALAQRADDRAVLFLI